MNSPLMMQRKPTKRLNFMNVTQIKSCYEEAFNNFNRIDEELLHFINSYVAASNDPLGNLEKNRKVAIESGKTEIAAI